MISLLFVYLSIFSVLLPLINALLQWKSLSKNLKPILYLTVISFVVDAISFFCAGWHINTWGFINSFYVIQFALLFIILSEQRKIPLLRLLFYGCLLFAVINFLFIQTPKVFNTYTAYAGGILIITVALNYIYFIINETYIEKIQTLPLFWLSFGVLVYYGGTLFLFLFNNYLIEHFQTGNQVAWVLHNLLNVVKNIFLFIALWVHHKRRKSLL